MTYWRKLIILKDPDAQLYDSFDHRLNVQVDPPGRVFEVRHEDPSPGEKRRKRIHPMSLWYGSIVDNLYKLSDELANIFDWPESSPDESGRIMNDAAAWFVLTGEAPRVQSLYGRWEPRVGGHLDPQWRVQLIVAPWMPPEEVAHAYRFFRERMPEGRGLPKTTRPLEVTGFVWRQERLNGYHEPRPWRAWWEQWNAESPEGDRFEDYRHFRTYFLRGEAAVKGLNFNWPETKYR